MAAGRPLEELTAGERIRVQGGRNFEKFHGGMEGTIIDNKPEDKNMIIQFDDAGTSGSEPTAVAYRHLEFAPQRGGYRAGSAPQAASKPAEASGPMLDEHNELKKAMLVRLHGLQGAAELNGKLGRLRCFDPNADRWEVDVREAGSKRLKEENIELYPGADAVPSGMSVEEYKSKGNDCFKGRLLEQAVAYYSACIDLLEAEPPPPEAADPKYTSVVFGNRCQCFINLCREVHGEDRVIGKEARMYAMRANMDSAKAVELDPTNGKAYYRRGCAVLGMAPSASRAKEAIYFLEIASAGRASGGKDGVLLPNAMRHEVSNLLDYAKRRLDSCIEAAVPDVEQCRENCRQS